MDRKAVQPFTFSDGMCIPKGNLIYVAQQVVIANPAHYDDPLCFKPFRFVGKKDKEQLISISQSSTADRRSTTQKHIVCDIQYRLCC